MIVQSQIPQGEGAYKVRFHTVTSIEEAVAVVMTLPVGTEATVHADDATVVTTIEHVR